MKDKVFELIENDIKDVISRFGIDAGLYPTEYGFISDTFKLTPRIFKDIRLKGNISVSDGDKSLEVTVSVDYRYNTFDGGMNGAKMCSIYYFVENGFDKHMDNTENYKWLFNRRFVTLPQC